MYSQVRFIVQVAKRALCVVLANRVTEEFEVTGEKKAGRAASEAVKILQEWDEMKEKKGKRWFYP